MSTKVHDIFRKYPKAADYLLGLGICECEGLQNTLKGEAEKRKLDINHLLAELNKRMQ